MSKLDLESLIATALEKFSRGEDAAQYDAEILAAQKADERRQRAERLSKLGLELEADTHRAIVEDHGLIEGVSLTAVRKWLWNPSLEPILILVGAPGCGKSAAAAWAVASFTRSSCWYAAADVVRLFASGIDRDAEKARFRMKRSHLTVLDDVATEKDDVGMCAALIEILQSRDQRRTIITTNQSQADWLKRYPDPRLDSRLNRAHFVYDKGPDLRAARREKADAERKAAKR
jgi:DNA replication protein DnaC